MRQVRFTILLVSVISILAGEGLNGQDRLATGEPAATREPRRRFDAVHAVGGRVFGLSERNDGSITISWVPTAMPAADAFGLSPDGMELVYMPLIEELATGELWRERLDTGERSRVTPRTIIVASVGASEPFTVAFTYATGTGFGGSVADLRSGVETTIPSPYLMPDFIRVDAHSIVSYFEEDDPLLAVPAQSEPSSLRATSFDPASGSLTRTPSDSAGYPQLLSEVPSRLETTSDAPSHATSFIVSTGNFDVAGDTFLGEASLVVRDRDANTEQHLGKGVLLDVLRKGVVVRRITPNTTYIEYVTFAGHATFIGTNAELTFTLPLERSTLTRNGTGYADQCGIAGISPHTGAKRYAYDFQSLSAGAHIFAVAPGSIVGNPVDNVTCNSLDRDCSTYSDSCSSNGGWGNSVVYRLSDGTYIRTAHHRPFSYQLGNSTTLCVGRYYARQGSTGNSEGNAVDGCGAHVHIQRQTGTSSSSESVRMQFTELNNAGRCGREYRSSTGERSSCPATVLSEDVESNASSWRYETFGGIRWGVESTSTAHSGRRNFRSNNGRSSYMNSTDASVISPAFSLAGFQSAELTFWTVYRTEEGDDYLRVEVSANGGSWREIARYSGVSSTGDNWRKMTVRLDQYRGYSRLHLRFRLTSDWFNTDRGIVLDDIVVIAQ